MQLNEMWETHIKKSGADFVRFVDISSLPEDTVGDYTCAALFVLRGLIPRPLGRLKRY